MKQNTRKRNLYLILILLNLAFIWGNSCQTGEASGELSSEVLQYVARLFAVFGNRAEFVLRKLAHFSEFACLGFLLTRAVRLLGLRGNRRFTAPLLPGILAACVDETIQIYTPGRGSSLIDVWIDVSGVCMGILVLNLLAAILMKTRKKR